MMSKKWKQLLQFQLTNQISQLLQSSNESRYYNNNNQKHCSTCNKSGHISQNCFESNPYFHCNIKDHISKYCPQNENKQKNNSILIAAWQIGFINNDFSEGENLVSVERINIKANILGNK